MVPMVPNDLHCLLNVIGRTAGSYWSNWANWIHRRCGIEGTFYPHPPPTHTHTPNTTSSTNPVSHHFSAYPHFTVHVTFILQTLSLCSLAFPHTHVIFSISILPSYLSPPPLLLTPSPGSTRRRRAPWGHWGSRPQRPQRPSRQIRSYWSTGSCGKNGPWVE